MSLDPIVFNVPAPLPPPIQVPPRFKLLANSAKTTKIITAVSAIVIGLSMVSFTVFTTLTNNKQFKKSHNITTPNDQVVPEQTTGSEKSAAALPGAGVAVGSGGTTGNNSPVVTLSAEPASVMLGGTSQLKWSVTNNPSSCVASDDWSGNKATTGGSEATPALTKSQTYIFTLTCKTATGTGFSTVSVGTIQQGGVGAVAVRPGVTLSATPSTVYVGQSATLTWSSTNSPSSCTASGDWSGARSLVGPADTGVLTTAKTYTYTLTCKNGAGSGYATTTVKAIDIPPDLPVVGLANSPSSPVTPGTSVTLTWSMIGGGTPSSCVASGDWTGNKATGGGSQVVGPLNSIQTYTFTITCSNSTGSTNDTATIGVIPNPPGVSLTVSPSSMYVGNASTLTWSASNSPSSCTASGDWTGAKSASGSASTGTLNTAKTYTYSLSCTNAGGTGYANNIPLTVTLPPAPVVTISASPISITAPGSSNLTWSATNNPTTCTAGGSWSGAKASSGTVSTGTLSTSGTFGYSLTCSNAGGSGSASTSVSVASGGATVVAPVVTISVNPTSIGTGSQSTISWSATNNPTTCTGSGSWSGSKGTSGSTSTGVINTAGTYTYTLACSNSAGSDTKSASLTVIAVPVVTISVSPSSINTGASANISWSATNNPSSCTGGGSWSGSKAASGGPVTTGAIASPGSYVYSLSCTNAGGTGSASATLTVANAAPVYCGGGSNTPCYGVSQMASHASSATGCWAWNNTGVAGSIPWVINISSFRPSHPGGNTAGTLESSVDVCNHDIHAILAGTAAITGYKDKNGSTKHSHNSGTTNNSSQSGVASASYHVGFYDPTKP